MPRRLRDPPGALQPARAAAALAGAAAIAGGVAAAARWALIRRRSQGEVAPVHQESAAYRAGGGPGVAAILM